jgi:Tfp pilus assembly protein PilF
MSPREWGVLQSALAPRPAAAPPPANAAPPAPIAQEWLLKAARELTENRTDAAGRALAEALVADPSEPSAYALEGFLHDVSGRTDEAMASYRAALYLDPSLFQVRLLLAECLKRLGSRDRAEHHYREVLAVLGSGRGRALAIFEGLPLPDREAAGRRCRQALKSG